MKKRPIPKRLRKQLLRGCRIPSRSRSSKVSWTAPSVSSSTMEKTQEVEIAGEKLKIAGEKLKVTKADAQRVGMNALVDLCRLESEHTFSKK
jgi:hypothetical protein